MYRKMIHILITVERQRPTAEYNKLYDNARRVIKNNRYSRDGFRCWTDAVIYIPLQTYRRLRWPFRSFYNSNILLSSLLRSRSIRAKKNGGG